MPLAVTLKRQIIVVSQRLCHTSVFLHPVRTLGPIFLLKYAQSVRFASDLDRTCPNLDPTHPASPSANDTPWPSLQQLTDDGHQNDADTATGTVRSAALALKRRNPQALRLIVNILIKKPHTHTVLLPINYGSYY